MTSINREAERDRLNEIFAQIEAEMRGETYTPEVDAGQAEHEANLKSCEESIERQISQPSPQLIGNIRQMIRDDIFATKRERMLARACVKLYEEKSPSEELRKEYGKMRDELERYRNFVKAVGLRLYNAIETAKAQDNHHYYKMFAEACREMMEKL